MSNVSTWSPTDESNTAAPPAGAPEGMLPSAINNTIRAMMGAVRRFYDNTVLKTGSTMTGTLSAPRYDLTGTAFADRGSSGEVRIHDSGGEWALSMTSNSNVYRNESHHFQITDAGLEVMNIGPSQAVHVAGQLVVSGAVHAASYVTTSDRRGKTDILPSARGLDEIRHLAPVEFCRIATPGRRELGLVAQDVEGVLPEAVRGDPDESLGINYDAVVTCLVAAVQQLSARVIALEGGKADV